MHVYIGPRWNLLQIVIKILVIVIIILNQVVKINYFLKNFKK